MKVRLKGNSAIANKFMEMNPGVETEIKDSLFDPETMEIVNSPAIPVNPEPEATPTIPIDFRKELVDLKGIGEKTADKILELAKSKEELKSLPRSLLIIHLRDDLVGVLDKYLGR